LVPDIEHQALQKKRKMMIFKTTAVALLSSLLIGVAAMPVRSTTVEAKATLVEKIPTKGGAPSPLGGQSPVDESRTAFASQQGGTNCKPSNLYSNGVVGDPESCIMGDRLGIAGGHAGGGR
jgi:hypothetical protein